MEIKDFLYEQDFSDIKKAYLLYNIAEKSTTITSIRKGWYKENDLKFDCKQNFLLKFPSINKSEFEDLWIKELSNFNDNKIDFYEQMDSYAAELIFKIVGDKMYEFIRKKIEDLNLNQKELIMKFINNSPENTKDYSCEYNGAEGDFYISLGLLYKGSYYDSEGTLKNSNYSYYPRYFSDIKDQITRDFKEKTKIIKKKRKDKTQVKKSLITSKQLKDEIFRLIVIKKGRKGNKKVKVGISDLEIGAEFGGQEQKFFSIKCGSCGSMDRFTIDDIEQKLFKCAKCQAINHPIGKDLYYFED